MKNNENKPKTNFGSFLKYNWFFIVAGVAIALLLWLSLGYSI